MPALLDDRIDRYQQAILAYLKRRLPAEAEELAQEVWLRVARAAPAGLSDAAFRAYAFATARRLLVDHHRRRRARIELVSWEGRPEPGRAATAEGTAHAAAILEVVEEALAAMPRERAEVFRLRTTSPLSFREIAAQQGCPLNTALGRMHQATRDVRAALAARGLTGGEAP